MVDYVGAIKKPFGDIQTLVIGIIIGLIPIVGLLNTGYGVLTARKVLSGDKKLLKWDPGKIVDMILGFIIVLIVSIVYMIPAAILFAVGLAGAIISVLPAITDLTKIGVAIAQAIVAGGLFFLIGIVLLVVAVFLLPMAIMNYIKNNSIAAAFSFGTVLKKCLRLKYIASLIVLIVYMIVLWAVAAILSIIPIVGVLIAAGVVSYLSAVTGYTIMAETYS